MSLQIQYRWTRRTGLAPVIPANVGTKCSHNCLYCSTGALMRMHPSFRAAGESPFDFGFAIVDPTTPERVARDARQLRTRGVIQLCTIVDAWALEAQKYNLGRRCLEAILAQPGWRVRILTKNAAVRHDFDFIAKHRDRVQVGLSLTGTADKEAQLAAIEQNASPISERMAAMKEAHAFGLRTYGMLCPLLPGIADDEHSIQKLAKFCLSCGAEEIFVEPVNARGPGMRLVQEALRKAGFNTQAEAVAHVRKRKVWSGYCTALIRTVQSVLRGLDAEDKLRFLLYPANLLPEDLRLIRQDDAGVRWLGK